MTLPINRLLRLNGNDFPELTIYQQSFPYFELLTIYNCV
jgi:hypothetical protein